MRTALFFFLSMFLVSLSSRAQVKEGSLLIGGDLYGSSVKTSSPNSPERKQSGFFISPVFGKAIRENLVLGGLLGYGREKLDHSDPSNYNDVNTSRYRAGVFMRKYRNIGSSGFYLFLQGNLNWDHSQEVGFSNQNKIGTTKTNQYAISAYPGLSYAVSKSFHIEAGLNNLVSLRYYSLKNYQPNDLIDYNEKGVYFSSSLDDWAGLSLGIRLLLGK